MNKAVITRSTGVNLGTVAQLWVDTEDWKVVSLDLRDNVLFGDLDCVLLQSLRQVGDVILVNDESALERDHSVYGLYPLVGSEVITETGEFLGRVREFTFNPEDGAVARLIFDAFGIPLVPDSVVSCYALSVEEVVSVGPDRIVVRQSAESRVQQLTQSLLQRLALAEAPWEENMRYGYYSGDEYQPEYRYDYDMLGMPKRVENRQQARRGEDDGYNSYYAEQTARRRQQYEQRPSQPQRAPAYQEQDPYQQPRAEASSKKASVRLYGPRSRPAPESQRDADGGFGDLVDVRRPAPPPAATAPPPPRQRSPAQPQPPQRANTTFDEWLEPEDAAREYVPVGAQRQSAARRAPLPRRDAAPLLDNDPSTSGLDTRSPSPESSANYPPRGSRSSRQPGSEQTMGRERPPRSGADGEGQRRRSSNEARPWVDDTPRRAQGPNGSERGYRPLTPRRNETSW